MSKRSRVLLVIGGFFLLLLLLLGSFSLGFVIGHSRELSKLEIEKITSLDLVQEALGQIQSSYVEKVPTKKLIQGAIRGMVDSLDDPYTKYLGRSDFKHFQEQTSGYFYGVGIEIGMKDNQITVISPIEGTPAARAGIKPGDAIVKIDRRSTKKMSLNKAVSLIRGEKGTKVVLTILRPGTKEPLEFTLVRERIDIPNVASRKLNKEIGYIRIHFFGEKTAANLEQKLSELAREGMKGLVLDLRNNPGGLLEEAVEVGSKFIKSGPIVSIRTRGREPQIYRAQGKVFDFPLVILVNKGSASASEIVAGAVQDTKRGVLVGEKTFGKGSVQSIVTLSDESGLSLTTGRYYTPGGRMINKKGITPDVIVEFKKEEKEDPQLKKAEEVLKEMI